MENTKPLYHYTSQKGLLGILETKKLWMTNILYLNDSSEFIYTINLVKQELKNRKEEMFKGKGIPTPSEGELYDKYTLIERVLDGFLNEIWTESYLFSLSTEGNDLNQWRGYCPKEGGFCIEFNVEKLLSLIKKKNKGIDIERYIIYPCQYKQNTHEKLIKSLFEDSLFLFKVDSGIESKKMMEIFYNKFLHEIVHLSTYIKDESFEKENEYRIVYQGDDQLMKYREGKSLIIPYIEVDFSDDDNKLPISKIIVGPTPHPELSKLSVEGLLKSNRYDIEVEISEIPYRSW